MLPPLAVHRVSRPLHKLPAPLVLCSALIAALVARLALAGWPALVVYAVAAALFVDAAQRRAERPATIQVSGGALLAGYGLLISTGVSLIVKRAEPAQAFPAWGLVLVAWLTAVGAYALAWASPRHVAQSLGRAWEAHRYEVLTAVALILAALLLRTVSLDRYPRAMSGDEGMAAIDGRHVLTGEVVPPFSTAGIALGKFPALYFYGEAAAMRLFGDDVAGARMFSALLGTGAVAVLYLLGRQWFGPTVGLVAAAVLGTLPYHLFWSRNALNNVGDTLAVVCFLLFATRALASGRPLDFALAGLILGVGQYAYQSARVLFGVLGILLLREVVIDHSWLRRNWSNLLIFMGGLIVAYLPQAAFFLNHPDDYTGRLNQVSIFQSGWLAHEMQRSGRSSIELIAEQIRRTFLVFNVLPPSGFFEPGRPMLDPLGGVTVVFGAVYAAINLRQRSYFALLLTLSVFLLAVSMTENPPNGARLVVTAPLAALLAALGLARCAQSLGVTSKWVTPLVTGVAATVIAAQSIHFYFVEYPTFRNHEPGGTLATELAYYMRQFPVSTRFLLLGDGGMSCGTYGSLKFIAPSWECGDVPKPPGVAPRPTLQRSDVVVARPDRRAEAESWLAARGWSQVKEIGAVGPGREVLLAFEPG